LLPLCHDAFAIAYCSSPSDGCWLSLLRLLSTCCASATTRIATTASITDAVVNAPVSLAIASCHTSWLLLFAVEVSDTACCTGTEVTDIHTNIVPTVSWHATCALSPKATAVLQQSHCCSNNYCCCQSIVELLQKKHHHHQLIVKFVASLKHIGWLSQLSSPLDAQAPLPLQFPSVFAALAPLWSHCCFYNCHQHQMIVTSVACFNKNILFVNCGHCLLLHWCWCQGRHCCNEPATCLLLHWHMLSLWLLLGFCLMCGATHADSTAKVSLLTMLSSNPYQCTTTMQSLPFDCNSLHFSSFSHSGHLTVLATVLICN